MRNPTADNSAQTSSPTPGESPRALALAKRLALRRETVELQGTVIHRSRTRVLAVVLAFSAGLLLLGPLAPLPFIVLLLMVQKYPVTQYVRTQITLSRSFRTTFSISIVLP